MNTKTEKQQHQCLLPPISQRRHRCQWKSKHKKQQSKKNSLLLLLLAFITLLYMTGIIIPIIYIVNSFVLLQPMPLSSLLTPQKHHMHQFPSLIPRNGRISNSLLLSYDVSPRITKGNNVLFLSTSGTSIADSETTKRIAILFSNDDYKDEVFIKSQQHELIGTTEIVGPVITKRKEEESEEYGRIDDDDSMIIIPSLNGTTSRRTVLESFITATGLLVVVGTTIQQHPVYAADLITIPSSGVLESSNKVPKLATPKKSSTRDTVSTSSTITTTSTNIATTAISAATSTSSTAASTTVDWQAIFSKASKKALGGGKAGASAAVVQVLSLMWLRTCMNYQYRYGGSLQSSLQTLWSQGGIQRLYQGLPFALIQGPLTRFGDTAANVGILALLETIPVTQNLPLPIMTACGSISAGLWRIFLMPIDTSKTAMQVEGPNGFNALITNVQQSGLGVLYRGSLAQAAATAVGHFPWFLTYNFLDTQLPMITAQEDLFLSLTRSAILGLSASCVSDCCSNSLRVIKTTKQTASLARTNHNNDSNKATTATIFNSVEADTTTDVDIINTETNTTTSNPLFVNQTTTSAPSKELSYTEIVTMIIEKDGIFGLLGRGLQTRLLTNAIQGAAFSVLWRYFQQMNNV